MSLPPPTTPEPTPTTLEHLPDDPAVLKSLIAELLASLHQQQRDNDALRHRIASLLQRLYGPRNERFLSNQPLLFPELNTPGDQTAATTACTEPATPSTPKRRCRPHGRRRLPDNLPRQTVHHQLSEAERICPDCGQQRQDIGVDTSEQLEYRPASLQVIEHVVHKYVCPCCRLRLAPAQEQRPEPTTEPMSTPQPQPQPAACADLSPGPGLADPEEATTTSATSPPPSQPGQPSQASTPAGPGVEPSPVVITASRPATPIAKGLPGPGLLAHLIVSKYVDHLPLHRLERVYERQGVLLPRSTLCDWLAACADLLQPLYEMMVAVVLQSRWLHTDDTVVKLQDPVTHQLSTARLWGYLGDSDHPDNVFDFTVNRKRDGPQRFLASYQGYLQADAFTGYDGLYLPQVSDGQPRIYEVACNAHARRKFYEARDSDMLRSHQALAYYRQLYELERQAQTLAFSESQRYQMRQDLAVPILNQLHTWLVGQRAEVLPKSPMAEAIGYALNNWAALRRYTEAGFLSIDNNVAEREMKRIAIGRKNWLFVGSAQGGRTAAVLFSFTSTCARLRIEPWSYLEEVLRRLPTMAAGELGELLPQRWQASRAAAASSPSSSVTPASSPSEGDTSVS
jgi:transposase